MSPSLGIALLVSQSALGLGGHHKGGAGRCDDCGVEAVAVMRDVRILQAAPRWRDRDNAAHRLGKIGWKCHPEIVHALAFAMLRDCKDDVREEAAESLKKLSPCVPEVHEALARSARCDPDSGVRTKARKALKALGKACDGPCSVCGPSSITEVLVAPGEPILVPPGEAPPEWEVVPPGDLPAPLPGPSPFVPGLDSSKKEREQAIAARKQDAPKRPDRLVRIGRPLRIGSGR